MAKLTNESLLMIQTGDKFNSIKAVDLKSYYAPLAVQPDSSRQRDGIPGIMFPSEQFIYNAVTGELSLRGDNNVIRELIGYIGYTNNVGSSINGLPVTPSMVPNATPGQYLVVIDPDYKYMTNDWSLGYYETINPDPSNIRRVYVGDEVTLQDDGDWKITRNLVSSNVFMLKDLTNYPHISQIQEP